MFSESLCKSNPLYSDKRIDRYACQQGPKAEQQLDSFNCHVPTES
ncbi:hypothetical protein NC653_028091 [Populus alba x Populus x berolinensis]|uniref:Uncharacterized protein n=1 Tax=Populus alba x Populus x berolinensis TaxID=444605 RepID=A0AAD6M730_9ROSI|nr:hypothetical protein NC653_028091 [Populus alba x Populus x berolinensis]